MVSHSNDRRGGVQVNAAQKKHLVKSLAVVPGIALAGTLIAVTYLCYDLNAQANRLEVQLDALLPLFFAVAGFVLVSAISLIANARMIAHRVEGPAYRLRKSLEKVAEGDLSFRVTLRQRDHLIEVSDALNRVLDVLNENPPEGFRTRAMRAAEAKAGPIDPDSVPAPIAVDEETPVS